MGYQQVQWFMEDHWYGRSLIRSLKRKIIDQIIEMEVHWSGHWNGRSLIRTLEWKIIGIENSLIRSLEWTIIYQIIGMEDHWSDHWYERSLTRSLEWKIIDQIIDQNIKIEQNKIEDLTFNDDLKLSPWILEDLQNKTDHKIYEISSSRGSVDVKSRNPTF